MLTSVAASSWYIMAILFGSSLISCLMPSKLLTSSLQFGLLIAYYLAVCGSVTYFNVYQLRQLWCILMSVSWKTLISSETSPASRSYTFFLVTQGIKCYSPTLLICLSTISGLSLSMTCCIYWSGVLCRRCMPILPNSDASLIFPKDRRCLMNQLTLVTIYTIRVYLPLFIQDLLQTMARSVHCLGLLLLLLTAWTVSAFSFKQLTDSCNNFDNENGCRGQQTDNDPSWAGRAFQTPPRGDPLWRESYQDYNILVGYARTVYTNGGANVTVVTRVNPAYSSLTLKYFFGDASSQSSSTFVSNSFKSLLTVRVEAYDGGDKKADLKIDDVDFTWNHPTVNQPSNFKNGQKGAIIEMFGWPYDDIADECEMIGKAGYLGVKVFPPSEAILDFEHPENGELNPWYWLYQPVSYKLHSRQGNPKQLRNMINTCRSKGVRVYADAVVNHMVGNGNDMFPSHCSGGNYWGSKNSSGGSPFWSQGFAYQNWTVTNSRPGMELPAVPYGPNDFHCARSLNSWTDGFILNYGWLVNLADLNTETDYVRQRIADYFTALLGMGFSGFRIDAAKHISPTNLAAILAKFKANLGGKIPDDFITYLEVIIGGEKDLLMCQDNNYNFGRSFANFMKQQGLSDDDINKVKIWQSDYPKEFPLCGWPIPSERYAIQLDCHDDQFPGSSSRDMGDTGSVLVKQKDVDRHRNFNIQMFNRNDGNWQIKLLLSSYTFFETVGAYGFPDGHSDCKNCATPECRQKCSKSMPYSKAHRSDVCGYTCIENGSWQQGVYTRVHRDLKTIKSMRQWMGLNSGVSPRDVGLPDNCS